MNQDTWNEIKALPTYEQKEAACRVLTGARLGRFELHQLLCDDAALPSGIRLAFCAPDGVHPDRGIKVELLRKGIPLISRSTNDTTRDGANTLTDQFCMDLLVLAMSYQLPKNHGG